MRKRAVILFNLGGPDRQEAVQPFLFNLFNDRAILRLPQPFRFMLAQLISRRRAPVARAIYKKMGGGSPILANTQAQAAALENLLNQTAQEKIYKTFIAMRYWHPFADEIIAEVKNFAPDEIILLPLYPQFSTTTTASSLDQWHSLMRRARVNIPTRSLCCYPWQEGFIHALAEQTRGAFQEAQKHGHPRILFSAHGLPQKIVDAGDPYQAQCEMTVAALRSALNIQNLDSVLCFQSRVGPLQWIKPATDDEIKRAARDKVPVIIVPIAFVSDHSETLVEIDIEYRELALKQGAPAFFFVPPVGTAPAFIEGLAQIVRACEAQKKDCLSAAGARICPKLFSTCPVHS